MAMRALVLGSIVAVALGACSTVEGTPEDLGGEKSDSGSGSGTSVVDDDAGLLADVGNADGVAIEGGKTGDGGVEKCDGIDNDGNGVIDDVDVGHDGICDCLRIATLGARGTAGVGDVFASWLSSRSDTGATDLAGATLTASLLAGYQVVVVQDVHGIGRDYSPDEVAALKAWVEGGGGVMTLIGYADTSERSNVNLLLASFGISYGPEPILAKTGGSTVPITEWTPHPLTLDVTKVGIDNGYPVNGGGTLIARGGGWDVARAATPGKGHVFVWGDEWITFDSEWKDHPDYQVERLWLNAIKWLTPTKECQVALPPIK
jgi:hypothetical protein